ncbi:MAG: biopolymer transporter ExbD [Desulfobacterales bacterium]|nr:MAG: biopolymer transporter ExbD [Desulfobacterales bacterium]UCD91031.1 MAG: biopolymer transporter ExbD [Desulfobacterales bacterium]
MKIYMPAKRKARIEMLPLIDIVFLLLVVFIYAMLSMAVHRGLPVVLPTSTSVSIEKELLLSVTVKADGQIYVDKELVSLDGLTAALTRYVTPDKDPGVLLFADRDVSYQNLFQVLDRIRMADVHRISLQATIEQQR